MESVKRGQFSLSVDEKRFNCQHCQLPTLRPIGRLLVYCAVICYGYLTLTSPWVYRHAIHIKDVSCFNKDKLRNATFIYLMRAADVRPLLKSLNHLKRNFLSRHPYQVLIFHEGSCYHLDNLKLKLRAMLGWRVSVKFVAIEFSRHRRLSEGFVPEVWKFRFPGYQNMIHFWFNEVFEHPEVAGLEYYCRLDVDSFILSPIKEDLFEFMHRHNFSYGYRELQYDSPAVTKGLIEFISNYSKDVLRTPLLIPAQEYQRPLMYYNNIEIVHIPTFRRPDVRRFVDAVDRSENIFRLRWGDAPLRYYTVRQVLNEGGTTKKEAQVHLCQFDYRHGRTTYFFPTEHDYVIPRTCSFY